MKIWLNAYFLEAQNPTEITGNPVTVKRDIDFKSTFSLILALSFEITANKVLDKINDRKLKKKSYTHTQR